MNQLKLFENAEFGQIRTIDIEGKPYFVASDVAKALGYSNTRDAISRHCRGVVKHDGVSYTVNQHGKRTEQINLMSFIPEGDIYRLIVRSKLPSAEKFERWVFDEVLPSIRERGVYATAETAERLLNDPDFMIKTFTALKEVKEENKALESKIEEMKPKVEFTNDVMHSENNRSIGQLAKMINQNGVDIGQNRLFKWMRENGYLIKRRGDSYNTPTQRTMDLRILEVKERTVTNGWGEVLTSYTPKVTGRGQLYFINLFRDKKESA